MATTLETIKGRDFEMPTFPGRETPSPRYDSVVINSTGVSPLTLAGRLSRSEAFEGQVRIVAEPVAETPRLLGGVTLRARALDMFAAAMGVDRVRLIDELFGAAPKVAETHRQFAALLSGSAVSGFRIENLAPFMDQSATRADRPQDSVLAYGVRNSRLRAVLQKLAIEAGAILESREVKSREDLLQCASGQNPLIVNATPRPLPDTPLLEPPQKAEQFVAAAQMALRASSLEKRGLVSRYSSFVCWIRREGALDMGVYYPFLDSLSPQADYYGIFYRVERGDKAKKDKQALLDTLESTVVGVGDLFGLEPVQQEQTLGTALVPLSPWKGIKNSQAGVLDLSRIAGSGAPIITGDGMLRSAIAGLIGGESLLAGRDPVADIDHALKRYRQLNFELYLALTRLSLPASWLMKRWPGLTLFRQTQSYYRDMWAGVT